MIKASIRCFTASGSTTRNSSRSSSSTEHHVPPPSPPPPRSRYFCTFRIFQYILSHPLRSTFLEVQRASGVSSLGLETSSWRTYPPSPQWYRLDNKKYMLPQRLHYISHLRANLPVPPVRLYHYTPHIWSTVTTTVNHYWWSSLRPLPLSPLHITTSKVTSVAHAHPLRHRVC